MSDPMPTPPEPDENRWIYWTLAAILVVLAVIGVIAYNNQKNDQEAQQMAAELTAKFRAAGLPVPHDQDIIINSLGNDGGAVCENPADALGKAILSDQFSNGAAFVGRRPVIIDRRILLGEALILEIYCPEELEEYQDHIKDLKTDDTIED